MNALVFDPADGSFKLVKNHPIPSVEKPGDVLVRVKRAGLCGTDLHIIKGAFSRGCKGPTVLGHEFCGVVVASGAEAVQQFPPGTRVGIDPNRGCFECDFCLSGNVHFCQPKGVRAAVGVDMDGGFAEYALVPHGHVNKLTDEVTFEQGALCEPLSCLLHGWDRLQSVGGIRPEDRILIVGAGIIGNLWAVMLHHSGFRNVTMTELSVERQDIAKRMELGFKIQSPAELAKMMGNMSETEIAMDGFGIIIDCTGYPPALEQALAWTKRGAKVCVFGCAPPGAKAVIYPEQIFDKELTIFGTLVNPLTYRASVRLAENLGQRYLDLDRLGIKQYKIQDFEQALQDLKTGSISKVMFDMEL